MFSSLWGARWPKLGICHDPWAWIVFLNWWAAMDKSPTLEDKDIPRLT